MRLLFPAFLLAACLLAALRPTPAGSQSAPGAPARSTRGMVASTSAPASEIGAEVLRRGGNAVDAAVAVGLALAVTYPAAGNLGGGGFMVIRRANGSATALDFRERAPEAARRDMYLDARGEIVPDASLRGHLASGVPGTVAGLALALKEYGTRPWAELVEPARRLAAGGFPVSPALAAGLRSTRLLAGFPESRRVFQRDGRYYAAGELFVQPDLAETLRRLRDEGPCEFYTGRTAALLAAEMAAGGGLITSEDLRRYHAVERPPLCGRYRGFELVTMPPPSSGGIALLQMLQMLERVDLRRLGPGSEPGTHLLVEVMRRAFADRARYPGDPDFVRVPTEALLSPRYAAERFRTIDPELATPSLLILAGEPPGREAEQTTHFSVIDAAGTAVSTTYTLNGGYGSGVTVRGAGFLLNNEMDDFTSRPGTPNLFGLIQGEANSIAPRKRPLSSMTPTIVTRGGRLRLVLGSPGGPTIINTVLQVVLNVVDHEMPLQAAVDAPRLHHQWQPDELRFEGGGSLDATAARLRRRGHRLAPAAGRIGDVQAILVDDDGTRHGASDRRSPDGRAVGE